MLARATIDRHSNNGHVPLKLPFDEQLFGVLGSFSLLTFSLFTRLRMKTFNTKPRREAVQVLLPVAARGVEKCPERVSLLIDHFNESNSDGPVSINLALNLGRSRSNKLDQELLEVIQVKLMLGAGFDA